MYISVLGMELGSIFLDVCLTLEMTIYVLKSQSKYPVLFKGLFVIQDFWFWAVWAAGPILKNKFWADYEQLLRAVSSCFQQHFFFEIV